jgi:hypothetical protein
MPFQDRERQLPKLARHAGRQLFFRCDRRLHSGPMGKHPILPTQCFVRL